MLQLNHYYIQEKIPILLVGNKIDLVDKRAISIELAMDLAEENGFMYIETSAKTGKNVDNAFKKLAIALGELYMSNYG